MSANFSSSRRGRGRLAPNASINVTSLLDITMVLLISFMIVAPTLKSGITMDLPEVSDATPVDSKESAVVVSVALGAGAEGVTVLIDDEEVSVDDLRERLQDLHAQKPKMTLMVEGDKSVPWEDMAKVIGAVEASGIPGMSLVTVPPKKTP